MRRTKGKDKTAMYLNRDCPPGGKRKSWHDENGKLHQGLLKRYLKKARRKGFQKIIFYSFKSDLKTIIFLKPIPLKRTK